MISHVPRHTFPNAHIPKRIEEKRFEMDDKQKNSTMIGVVGFNAGLMLWWWCLSGGGFFGVIMSIIIGGIVGAAAYFAASFLQ